MSEEISIASWNVNGLRSAYRKGLLNFIADFSFDILCLQEIKAKPEQLPTKLVSPNGYYPYFFPAQRPGYSGVAVYTRKKPQKYGNGFGIPAFDREGRVLWLDFGRFILFNTYMPNGGRSQQRLDYKLEFYNLFLGYLKNLLGMGKKIILAGDINTAHKAIDLARPRQNKNNTGFLPREREWIDELILSGFVDTFRMFERGGGHYTWWDYKTRARERNVGWRLDYFFCSRNMKGNIKGSHMLPQVNGSDHCPVVLKLWF
ncbi:MAG: exodeoxyribonuclease III [Actinomycetota bacterium]